MPRISILIPLLNGEKYLKSTVSTVQMQTYGAWELLMVDGGSPDRTPEIAAALHASDPRVRFLPRPGTSGWEAMYAGIAEARGEFVAIVCASDGYANAEWLKTAMRAADAHPDVSLIWGIPFIMNEDSVFEGPHPNYVMFLERKPRLWRMASIWHYLRVRMRYLNPLSWPALARKVSLKKAVNAVGQFSSVKPPQKGDWLPYWLKTGLLFPDGNMCVKKDVFYACAFADKGENAIKGVEQNRAFFDFYYNFNTRGYLPWCVPVIANFGRIHKGQLTQVVEERNAQANLRIHEDYFARIARFAAEYKNKK